MLIVPAPRPDHLARDAAATLADPLLYVAPSVRERAACHLLIARPERRLGIAYWGLPERTYGPGAVVVHPPRFRDTRGTMGRRGLVPLIGHAVGAIEERWRSAKAGWFAAVYDVVRTHESGLGRRPLRAHFALIVDELGIPIAVTDFDEWLVHRNLPERSDEKRRRARLRG